MTYTWKNGSRSYLQNIYMKQCDKGKRVESNLEILDSNTIWKDLQPKSLSISKSLLVLFFVQTS